MTNCTCTIGTVSIPGFEHELDCPRHPEAPTDNVIHDVDFGNSRASKIAPGVTLFTKDGSKVGNAIIVKQTRIFLNNDPVWLVETDFGNQMQLIENEILSMFELGRPDVYDRWWDARINAIHKGVEA